MKRWKRRITVLVFFVALGIGLDCAADAATGERFHEETKMTWFRALKETVASKPKKPPPFKEYQGEKMKLPKPDFKGISFEDAVLRRRSVRKYAARPLSLNEVSQLLFSAQGVTGEMQGILLRSAPSAGALYPFEIYVIANNIESLKKGIYHYSVRDHSLVLIKEGDFGNEAMHAALEQEMARDAGALFALSAIFNRVNSKYGDRGYRYTYMEAGHISQNLYLQAASLGLGSVEIGAFIDDDFNALIGVDGKEEAVVLLQAVGSVKK